MKILIFSPPLSILNMTDKRFILQVSLKMTLDGRLTWEGSTTTFQLTNISFTARIRRSDRRGHQSLNPQTLDELLVIMIGGVWARIRSTTSYGVVQALQDLLRDPTRLSRRCQTDQIGTRRWVLDHGRSRLGSRFQPWSCDTVTLSPVGRLDVRIRWIFKSTTCLRSPSASYTERIEVFFLGE